MAELRVHYDSVATIFDQIDLLVDMDPIELRDLAWNLVRDVETLKADHAAAEERGRAEGRQWAINTLRDDDAYHRHQQETGVWDGGRHSLADWLEAMAPGGTDG